jgi:hypothetical protein
VASVCFVTTINKKGENNMDIRVSFYQGGTLMLEESQDGQNWIQRTLVKDDVYGWQDPQGGNWYMDVVQSFGPQGNVIFRNDQGEQSNPPSNPQTNDPVSVSSRFWEQGGGGNEPPPNAGDGGVYKPTLPSVAKVMKPQGVAKVMKPQGVAKVTKPQPPAPPPPPPEEEKKD